MIQEKKCTLNIQSEIGKLKAVLIHYPAPKWKI